MCVYVYVWENGVQAPMQVRADGIPWTELKGGFKLQGKGVEN